MDLEYEIASLKHEFQQYKAKTSQKISILNKTISDNSSLISSQQHHFKILNTCLNVYIDTMKELRVEYHKVKEQLVILTEKTGTLTQDLELRSPDMVMVHTFQELQLLNSQRLKALELRLQTLQDEFGYLSSPMSSVHTTFQFENINTEIKPSEPIHDNLSPFTL